MSWIEVPHPQDAHIRVTVDRRRSLVRFTRTALPLPNENFRELVEAFARAMDLALPRPARPEQRLLFDSREAPKLVDPNMEPVVAGVFSQLMSDFGRVALLLRTPIGVLQIRRLARNSGLTPEVFYDEAEALSYLIKLAKRA